MEEQNVINQRLKSMLQELSTMDVISIKHKYNHLTNLESHKEREDYVNQIKNDKVKKFFQATMNLTHKQAEEFKQFTIDSKLLSEQSFDFALATGGGDNQAAEQRYNLVITEVSDKVPFIKEFRELNKDKGVKGAIQQYKSIISGAPFVVSENVTQDDEQAQELKARYEKSCTLEWQEV